MWNFRVIRTEKDGIKFFGLYEVFYNKAGEICAHDEEPTVIGESVDEIKSLLKMMMNDIDKHDILDGYKIDFKQFDQ